MLPQTPQLHNSFSSCYAHRKTDTPKNCWIRHCWDRIYFNNLEDLVIEQTELLLLNIYKPLTQNKKEFQQKNPENSTQNLSRYDSFAVV